MLTLRANGVCRGVVEIFQRPDVSESARAGYLQFVEQMTGYASLFLERIAALPVSARSTVISRGSVSTGSPVPSAEVAPVVVPSPASAPTNSAVTAIASEPLNEDLVRFALQLQRSLYVHDVAAVAAASLRKLNGPSNPILAPYAELRSNG